MKTFFLAGGFAGFLLCAVAGAIAGHTPGLIFRDAAIGCLASALLARWFWSVLARAFAQTLAARRRAAAEAAEAAQAAAQAAQPATAARNPAGASPVPAPARAPAPARPHLVTGLRPSGQPSR